VNDPAQAEDLAQDTFVKVFRNLAAFDPTRRLSSWLFRIAHHTAIDALRRARAPAVPLDALTPDRAPAVAPDPDPVEREALGAAIEQALAGVRPEYRAAITLRYEEGLSFEEIGQVLQVPAATARSHVHRARKELLRALTDAGWQPPPRPQRS
jgi:RNA polymerase sigma-70 factor, ECF subfamily